MHIVLSRFDTVFALHGQSRILVLYFIDVNQDPILQGFIVPSKDIVNISAKLCLEVEGYWTAQISSERKVDSKIQYRFDDSKPKSFRTHLIITRQIKESNRQINYTLKGPQSDPWIFRPNLPLAHQMPPPSFHSDHRPHHSPSIRREAHLSISLVLSPRCTLLSKLQAEHDDNPI